MIALVSVLEAMKKEGAVAAFVDGHVKELALKQLALKKLGVQAGPNGTGLRSWGHILPLQER
jgi:prepilin-type processing-associated H-X9-DG protein